MLFLEYCHGLLTDACLCVCTEAEHSAYVDAGPLRSNDEGTAEARPDRCRHQVQKQRRHSVCRESIFDNLLKFMYIYA